MASLEELATLVQQLQKQLTEHQQEILLLENNLNNTKQELSQTKEELKKTNETFNLQLAELKAKNTSLKIEHGVVHFNYWQSDHQFVVGTGIRFDKKYVKFTPCKFTNAPQVMVGLNYLDHAYYDTPLLVNMSAEDITISGFNMVIKTWGDTKLVGAGCNWLAYGE